MCGVTERSRIRSAILIPESALSRNAHLPVHPRQLLAALCDMVCQLHRTHDGLYIFSCDLFSIGAQTNRSLILALGYRDGHGALCGWGENAGGDCSPSPAARRQRPSSDH